MYTSILPELPPVPDTNAHNILFNRPDQQQWPADYPLLIEAKSGDITMFQQFKKGVKDYATAIGTGLKLQGGEQEIVGILSENSVEYVTLVHSLLYVTVPFALHSSFATKRELIYSFKLTNTTRLFVSPALYSRALEAAKEVGIPRGEIYIFGGKRKGVKNLDDIVQETSGSERLALRPAKKDTLAYLVLSSGTSGLPKAVKITHGNLTASMIQALVSSAAALPLLPPRSPQLPVGMGILPVYHSYGLHAYCFRLFLTPTTLVMMRSWNLELALKAIKQYQISTLSLIPSMMHQLVNHPTLKPEDLKSIDNLTSGAAYLPPELKEKIVQLVPNNPRMTIGYGMSESTLAVLMNPLPGLMGRIPEVIPPDVLGILVSGVEARIVGPSGEDCGFNQVGELWIRGPAITPGYWGNEKATRESFVDGWFKTGDYFSTDKTGFFYFADRVKDTLKVSGMQVSPSEVEDTLLAQPDKLITDVTVAGVSGGRTSDEKVPRAWIVLSPAGKKLGEKKVIAALDAWVKENLSKYKWLRGGFEVVKEIPRTPTGKVLRRVLQDRYEKNFKTRSKL